MEKISIHIPANCFTADLLCGVEPEQKVKCLGENLYHYSFVYDLKEEGKQDACQICIQAPGSPVFAWSGHFRRTSRRPARTPGKPRIAAKARETR